MATQSLLHGTLALYHNGGGSSSESGSSNSNESLERILGNTTSLLANLTNPLNISLLTSHFLTAPAIWQQPDLTGSSSVPLTPAAMQACFRIISVYNTAAIYVRRHELEDAAAVRHGLIERLHHYSGYIPEARRPTSEAWARAVAEGADARSPRWRHLLVLVGVLLGLEGSDRQSLPRGRRAALEQGVVAAANLALHEDEPGAEGTTLPVSAQSKNLSISRYAVVLGITFAFPLLSEYARSGLHGDVLLPTIVAQLGGPGGFQGGQILTMADSDVVFSNDLGSSRTVVHWPAASTSFLHLQQSLESPQQQPLVANAGPLAALAAHVVASSHPMSPAGVLLALDVLLGFTGELAQRWSRCERLMGVDLTTAATEAACLSPETAQTTWPLLWQHLRKILYASVVLLQAIMGRSLLDRGLAGNDAVAPRLASTVLRVLHNLRFLSLRQGASAFQAYQFTYLAAIDVLARYPEAVVALLGDLLPTPPIVGTVTPASIAAGDPQRLTADLFYLNLAEHFAGILPSAACDRLLIQPALPYVSPVSPVSPDSSVSLVTSSSSPPSFPPRAVEVFEAAHSTMLSALSCPLNATISATLSPFYAEALLASFPGRISARQFRLAFKTLIQILSPPFPVYATHPLLAETLLEMVRMRATAGTASTFPLPPAADEDPSSPSPPVSEQSALVLTLIDALPFLALPVLQEWMTTVAETLWSIGGMPALLQTAQQRFWEVLGSGEMDVERAAMGVAWWSNGGGSELVQYGRRRTESVEQQPMMSGALPDAQMESKL